MKIRYSFVTNSSSSSFICQMCGAEESGRDLSLSDIDWYGCVHGHKFCDYCADELCLEELSPGPNHVPEEACPGCRLEALLVSDMFAYLLETRDFTEESLTKEIRDRFGSDREFQKFLHSKE